MPGFHAKFCSVVNSAAAAQYRRGLLDGIQRLMIGWSLSKLVIPYNDIH